MGLAHSTQINRIKKGKSDELALSHKKLDHICRRMYIPNTRKWLFSNNYISDVHPRVCFLKFLSTVDLSANELSSFPNELCSIPALRVLNLSFNKITTVPLEISKLAVLTELRLSFNHIHDLPHDIFDGRFCIERLELNNNFLEHLPRSIKNLTLLKHLNIQNNNFTYVPDILPVFAYLEELNLSHNKILDLSPSIGSCASLKTLQLHNNILTSFPPHDVHAPYLPALTHLRLNNNRIHTIQPTISRFTTLVVLNLRNNELGSLPLEITLLTKLARLNISLNRKLVVHDLSFSGICPIDSPRGKSLRDEKGKTPHGGNKSKSPRNPLRTNSPVTFEGDDRQDKSKYRFNVDKDKAILVSDNLMIVSSSNPSPSTGSQKAAEIIVSQSMVPTYEHVKAGGGDIYSSLKVVEEVPSIDTGLLDQHVELLLQQGVWSGGYDFPSVEDELRKTLLSITKIRDGLFLSSKYGAQDREALHSRGITHVLVVASELSPFFPDEFDYCVINVRDNSYTNDLSMHFPTCHKFIDLGRKKGGVLVHCSAGVSRSATVIMSYLMRTELLSFAQARKLQCYSDFLKAYRKKMEKRKLKKEQHPISEIEEDLSRTHSLTVGVYL